MEFALVLPIFALILFATIYVGFFVLDYVTLDAAAAAAAREAALNKNSDPPYEIRSETREKIKDRKRFLKWYTMVDDSPKITKETTESGDTYVTVMIQAELKKNNKLLDFLPKYYTVSKTAKVQ